MMFKKFKPNDYVMVVKNGKVVKEGLGLSVLYNDLTTNSLDKTENGVVSVEVNRTGNSRLLLFVYKIS